MTRAAVTHDFADRVACEECGEDHLELRRYPFGGWIPDAIWCRECFAEHDTENSFTDYPIIQEALRHA